MIIPDAKLPESAESVSTEPTPDEPEPEPEQPPTYTTLPEPVRGEPSSSKPILKLPRAKPSNFLYLVREHQSIKDTFVINPSLHIPASLLPPLPEGESESDRRNLKLVSVHGNIDVGIYLDSDQDSSSGTLSAKQPTTVELHSDHGYINAKLYAPTLASREPFHLTATVKHRSLTVHLPRTFHGPLTITAIHCSCSISEQLSENVTTFSEVQSTRKCFVGDFSRWGEGKEGWRGDEVTVYSMSGKIRLQFVDEVQSEISKGKGFVARLMGL